MPTVAVIDIGSNSIKLLVASRLTNRHLVCRLSHTLDARISTGLGQQKSRLSSEGMNRGLAAIRELLQDAAAFSPDQVVLAATSAVRDAANGAEFRAVIRDATHHTVRLLSGEEEARLIARGLACDPALARPRNFYHFDLGGGSLECLAISHDEITRAVSLPLGCVRLTENFLKAPSEPVPAGIAALVDALVRRTVVQSGFRFDLPAGSPAVGTGGTLTTVRAIHGERTARTIDRTDPVLTITGLESLLGEVGAMPLEARKAVPGLPPPRADVFPVALATLIALGRLGGFNAYHHSFYNLRWGLAAEALGV